MGVSRRAVTGGMVMGLLGAAAGWPLLAGSRLLPEGESWEAQREELVSRQLVAEGITDPRVLLAMRQVPRHLFVPESYREMAYRNQPLPIGHGQTISQPYVVAYMCEKVGIQPTDRILEIGTGSGYHAAVLSHLGRSVHSIEILAPLAQRSAEILGRLGYDNVTTREGDGYFGWPEAAPFDVIVVTAGARQIPPPLLAQLAEGGRLVIPVGHPFLTQMLVLAEKKGGEIRSRELAAVRFVPLTRGE